MVPLCFILNRFFHVYVRKRLTIWRHAHQLSYESPDVGFDVSWHEWNGSVQSLEADAQKKEKRYRRKNLERRHQLTAKYLHIVFTYTKMIAYVYTSIAVLYECLLLPTPFQTFTYLE